MIEIQVEKILNSPQGKVHLSIQSKIEKGSLIGVHGYSGAGKTTFLKVLAGLVKVDEGFLSVEGDTWLDTKNKISVKAQHRSIGYVFQDYALFPNMTVRENLEYALSKRQSKAIVNELMAVIELENLANSKPSTLSGGQQQRVALARALVRQPKILMLDEPFSALDYQMRAKLQDYLLKVHNEYNLTTFLVSHDVGEICKLADKVWVFRDGQLWKSGNPVDVFSNHNVSGKFQLIGEVLQVSKEGVVYVVSVLVSNQIVKVVAEPDEIKELSVGDKILVASKAFNPILKKIQ